MLKAHGSQRRQGFPGTLSHSEEISNCLIVQQKLFVLCALASWYDRGHNNHVKACTNGLGD